MFTPASVALLVSLCTVLVPLIFGILTLRQWRRSRELSAAGELVHTIQTPDFTRAIAKVIELPEAASALQVAPLSAEVNTITHGFESLGVLVFHRLLPLHLVDDLVGGYVRAAWKRTGPYLEGRRAQLGANLGEWFQWLAERLDQDPSPGKRVGAHVYHRNWRR